jgi:toxin HigB-1
LNIRFRTKKLKNLCESGAQAAKELGPDCAKRLMLRLVQLKAADTLEDMQHMPGARCHPLHHDRRGQFSVDLKHPLRLVFVPDHDPVPVGAGGGIELSAVTDIEIVSVVDYH